jgi:hypothetical protein
LVDLAPKSARLWAIRAGFQRRGPLHHRINISIVAVASLSRLRHGLRNASTSSACP